MQSQDRVGAMGADENSGTQAELTALAARVAALERQVAELSGAVRHPAQAAPVALAHEVRVAAVPPSMPGAPPPMPSAPPPMPDAAARMSLMPGIPPRAAVAPPPFAAPQAGRSLESRLGSQVFNAVGILAILAGTSYFLKLAIERGWVGPVARVLIGLVAGVALVLWSERFRRTGMKAFSFSLKAVGSAVLYLTLRASFHLYHQLPAGVALFAMVLVTAWNGFMAWSQDAELLAAYGLVGGFATPLLLASGGDHEAFLFAYVGAIDVATVLLLRWKPWRRLVLPAMAATIVYFFGYCARFFHSGLGSTEWRAPVWDGQSTETAIFALMFFAIFAVVSAKGYSTLETAAGEVIVPVLVPLVNVAFLAVALYGVMQDSGLHTSLAWLMVGLAALCLGLMRVQATAVAGAMYLASAVAFLTIAIPLKASGHSLTTAWLVEGLVLYWAATRVQGESGAPATVLKVLSAAGYCLGLAALVADHLWLSSHMDFFNAALASALIAVGALGGAAWLASEPERRDDATLLVALGAIDLVALLLTWREGVISQFAEYGVAHPAFANAEFATALVGLGVLAVVVWVGYRLGSDSAGGFGTRNFVGFAGGTLIAFNLLAILSVVREIGALWSRNGDDLQRSLAISGFLMAYGAALLAAGFWRRSAFVRWQGLVLLIFTIAKVFLYDISGLSQGYRVASFMGLGALLMGVSYAYQKDWLGLKPVAAPVEPPPPPPLGGEL